MDKLDVINSLLRTALRADATGLKAQRDAQNYLRLDDANWTYFFCLYRAKMQPKTKQITRIHEKGKDEKGILIAYPISIAPDELLDSLKVVDYAELKHSSHQYPEAARQTTLWVKKMQAGSGSSLSRNSYLSKQLGITLAEVKIGAKGTDLFLEIPAQSRSTLARSQVSIAEAQILQNISSVLRGEVGEVIFHDIVSSETEDSIENLWKKNSLLVPSKTYRDLINETPELGYSGQTHQSFIPTIDEDDHISFNRKAPGGHALFAVDALRAAFHPEMRPKAKWPLVAAISNGEDLNSSPDPVMLGYIVKTQVPIALVTTERTSLDLKGGLVSLIVDDDRSVSLTVLETAQAAEAGQGELFSRIPGMVNTNLALFNYEVLVPLLSKEVNEIGEDEFLKIIAPDLILNAKEQRDSDGTIRKYVQLEGAMGSTIMNLDRYWRKKHGAPLVHIINIGRNYRTDFFSPVKSAFDYFMQFHSDRFEVDPHTFRLINNRPGELPSVILSDPSTRDRFYQDVLNVLDAFKNMRIKDLDELVIKGKVKANDFRLSGNVRIINESDTVADLKDMLRFAPLNLYNITIEITPDKELAKAG